MAKTIIKRILVSVLCLLVAVVIFLICISFSIVNYGKIDEKTPCDVAIILGAATANGNVSPVYRERINHGIWLYDNGYVDYLIFTGGVGDGCTLSDAYAAKQYALKKGVPEEIIFIEEVSTITEENLFESRKIMADNSWETAIVVSDPLHMKRAMLMAKDYGIDAYSSPTPTTMYKTAKTKLPFLIREEFMYIGYCIVRLLR